MVLGPGSPPTLRVSSRIPLPRGSLHLTWLPLFVLGSVSLDMFTLAQSLPCPPSPAPSGISPGSGPSLPLFAHCDSRAGWSATEAAMSSLTTSSEGENSTPRFVVGSRDDETDFLESNMKMDETDFFEDDEEEESVRRSWHSGLEHLCRIPGFQPGFAWFLLRPQTVRTVGNMASGCVAQPCGRCIALTCCQTRCLTLQ